MQVIEMNDLKTALDEKRVDGLYDNRGSGSFGNLHIAGAEQLAVSDVAERLPDDKEAVLVFY